MFIIVRVGEIIIMNLRLTDPDLYPGSWEYAGGNFV